MLVLENVHVDLARTPVLRNVSVQFRAGSVVAVVGRNGAGKTTLLRTVMGLVRLKSGRILFDDDELQDLPAHWRAEQGIGYAPEDRVIFPTLTVAENMRLPCEAHGLSDRDIDDRMALVLEVVPQLRDLMKRSGAALSGGQGKMVALGRALMAGTRLVLLDEPFQGLAPVLALQYAEALGRLRQVRPDLCVIITESNASLLKGIPDQTVTLERGELWSDGPSPAASVNRPSSGVLP
ncbi:MAG TPA: ATP-binding cassette domain-containing protein [Microvirga sp.]|jgi:urea transport system ATP-binding protein|nr:ATP-binding cassette domain-containing protein [Microvirga sp.]